MRARTVSALHGIDSHDFVSFDGHIAGKQRQADIAAEFGAEGDRRHATAPVSSDLVARQEQYRAATQAFSLLDAFQPDQALAAGRQEAGR